ncbi:hypothetical protein BGZ93_002312 [Podila epicladia]|nr:hypothetical protein BGZ92_009092 [Podila epicladia]KAG0097648.1 hypothetical protein BGZ93_002312 [Podila epicladia]
MSSLTTTLAWLIPCIVLSMAIIAWRVYAYKTRCSVLPTYLQQNIFARTRSFVPKPIPDEHTAPMTGTAPHPSAPIRNETVIVIAAPVDTTETSEKASQPQDLSIPSGPSPAITRLLNMK